MRKLTAIVLLAMGIPVFGQENYEIQVYASPTMTRGNTIFELHSNYTFPEKKKSLKASARFSFIA